MAGKRVGLFLHDGENDYQKLMHSDAEQAARRHELALDVQLGGFKVEGKAVPTDLRIIGCDGSSAFGQRLIIQGKLAATIVVPPVSGRAIDAFAQRLAGRGRPSALELVAVSSQPSLEALRTKYRRLRL